MKRLLITLILVSPFSFADWGDVYYCQMTSFVGTDAEGTVTQYKLEKFQFKLDSTEKAVVFGKSGFFTDSVKPLDPNRPYLSIPESWWAVGVFDTIYFRDGKFMYSFLGSSITSISANCDKF